ncbi:MAG: hypothetical protein A2428_11745 [Bdellovibrionales bacterium RIFOXYC1_FULL_54_43]|nr:MAG: hypothetical protein A2428_11745 [Bdellovibrionales bacterium RIFOXYC1_FULL_54_43]OFZ81730.1 MAG: hypothetical protein A2603_09665 [Bdellovibrionales bacterium RIFOXYD1_FULL_55_31]
MKPFSKLLISSAMIAVPLIAAWASFGAEPPSADGMGTPSTSNSADAQRSVGLLSGEDTCTDREIWNFGSSNGAGVAVSAVSQEQKLLPVPEDFQKDWKDFLIKRLKPVQGFSEALGLRQISKKAEGQIFGEYWISRSLFEAKLIHVAHGGFSSIASRPFNPEFGGVQLAALGCLLRIHSRYPSLALPREAVQQFQAYLSHAKTPKQRAVVWEAAAAEVRFLVAQDAPVKSLSKDAERTLSFLKGAGAYETLGRALWAARIGNHKLTIQESEKFIASPAIPQPLSRYVDTAHIIAARALYSLGQYDKAISHWKIVTKSSNELARSLSELAWAQLMAEHYGEAIGTSMNLQAGGLRHTFAPESPMVMAMAMAELCQYPQSVNAIKLFQKYYEQSYRWLSNWIAAPDQRLLYPFAVRYLRKSQKDVAPERISSEWVRSPLFISHQDEINLLFDEKDFALGLGKSGAQEQNRLVNEILALIRDLKPRLHLAKMKQKPGEELPAKIRNDLTVLKRQMTRLRRLERAAPVWQVILKNHLKQSPVREGKLVAAINADLANRSRRMLAQLDEIGENLQLVEVEIYNGASHDIIWQNAHPDYKEIAEKIREDGPRRDEKNWDWGRSATGPDEEGGEIWEDELGSFKANLFDNCSSKDKYLAIKMKRVSQ